MKRLPSKTRLDHSSTVDGGVGIVYQQTSGGMRKIRCPRCPGIAIPAGKNAQGKELFTCQSCAVSFAASLM